MNRVSRGLVLVGAWYTNSTIFAYARTAIRAPSMIVDKSHNSNTLKASQCMTKVTVGY